MRRFALLLAVVLVIPSCGRATDGKPLLIICNNAEPQTLDPGKQQGTPEHHINIGLFEGLTVNDAKDLSIRPGIAERWEISEDKTVYTFHLRESKWSNGDPVTAHDFEWAWKRVCDPVLASEYSYQVTTYLKNAKAFYDGKAADGTLEAWAATSPEKRKGAAHELPDQVQKRHAAALQKALEAEKDPAVAADLKKAIEQAPKRDDVTADQIGVKAKDDKTLVVTIESSTPYFLDLCAFFTYYPVHRKTVETHGDRWTRPENSVCNGPFRLKEWKPKEHILLEKNPNYWNAGEVADQTVKFLPNDNISTSFNMYEQGQAHWLTDVPREYIEELLKRKDYYSGPMLTTYFYGFNVKQGVTANKLVRKALGLAINKDEIVKYITKAGEAPARSIVPPGLVGYAPALMPEFNVAEAKKLLAEAGYPDGKGFPKLELLYNTHEGHKKIAAAIQEMWKKHLNIEVELRNIEWKIFLEMQTRLEFQVCRRAWVGDYTDPNTFIDLFTSWSGQNNTGFSHAGYDKLVRDAAREFDPAKRMKLLQDAEAILMDELPVVPIYFYVTKNMVKANVQGFHDNVRDTHPLRQIKISGQAP